MAMQESYTCPADNLFAGTQVQPVVADEVRIQAGEGELPRGAVLGQITTANSATPTADGGNTGNGTIGAIKVQDGAWTGTYTLEITAKADGGDPATFKLTDPKGNEAEGTVGEDFVGLGLEFKVSEGATAFEVGDKFTIAVVEGNRQFRLCDSQASDGSQNPVCILAEAVDATDGDVLAPAYFTGEFNRRAVAFGGSDTWETHVDALRARGIFLKDTVKA